MHKSADDLNSHITESFITLGVYIMVNLVTYLYMETPVNNAQLKDRNGCYL